MSVVMGTAGHIDHGKTTLIKALTGVDCDRLEEEKRRGITIELGFAELRLPKTASGQERAISVIDVPGHERFVHTMVAGASGVDFVLMVIAADEGVMPQTREHLEICSLMGVKRGVVALTKIDSVDQGLLELAREEVTSFLENSFLQDAPIIPVSARTGQGLDNLLESLEALEANFAPIRSQDLFRIPVDRIFTLRGHGTVTTGTMIAGRVRLGDTVQVYPGKRTSKVRGLQSHFGKVQEALAGRRTAVNLPDLAVEDIRRGDVLSRPDSLFPSKCWTAWITCLPSSPKAIRNRAAIHLHHGSREMVASLNFLGHDKLLPGEACLCDIRLKEEAVGVFGDRLVLRAFSPLRTVAGGVLLNPLGVDTRKREDKFSQKCRLAKELTAQAYALGRQGEEALESLLLTQLICTRQLAKGLTFDQLKVLTNLDSRLLEKVLARLMKQKKVHCFDLNKKKYAAGLMVEPLVEACITAVNEHHAKKPEKRGMKKSELLTGWGKYLPPKLASYIIEQLVKKGDLKAQDEYVFRPSHQADFSKEQAPLGEMIMQIYRESGWTPPSMGVLFKTLNVAPKQAMPLIASLQTRGQLIRLSEDMYYVPEALQEIEKVVMAWFGANETLDFIQMKTLTGLSRKHMVPLMEHFDARQITVRSGNARMLRGKKGL